MLLVAFAFDVNEDVIEIHYHKNVEFVCQDLVIALERDQCVGQSKRHHLVLEIVIADFEGYFLFIAFFDPYPMIGINQVKPGKTLSPT